MNPPSYFSDFGPSESRKLGGGLLSKGYQLAIKITVVGPNIEAGVPKIGQAILAAKGWLKETKRLPNSWTGGRVLSAAEQAEFDAFAARARALGLTENPYRIGSWGRIVNGKFEEITRIDVAEIGKPGWRGKTHIHIRGQKGHLDPKTPLPGE
jgi:hypothetical protein